MVAKGHQVGAEPICLESLQEEDIIPEGGKGSIQPAHPGIPHIEMVVVYEQMPAVNGVSARDLS